VGGYDIVAALGSLTSTNYSFTFSNGTLTVAQAIVTVTADNKTRSYGAANPIFTASYSGFLNGDDTNVLSGSPSLTTSADTNSPTGGYDIVAALGTLSATNYAFNFVNGTLTVTTAPLGITANNDSKTYDGTGYTGGNGVSYTGFVNGETSSVLGGSLSYGGTSQNATNAGSYSIIPSGLTSTNYAISFTNGTLTINQASISIGAISSENPAGYKDAVSFQATLPVDATGSVVFLSASGPFSTNTVASGNATSSSLNNLPRGTDIITITYLGDGNYFRSTNTLNQMVTNHPPVASDVSYTRNTAVNSIKIPVTNLLANASDVDGDTLSLASVSATTNNATISIADGCVLYRNTNAVTDQFTYTVSDGFGGTSSATVTINVDSTPLFGQSQIASVSGGTATLNFAGIPGYGYSVQRSTNLMNWATIWTTNAPLNGMFQVIDPTAPEANAYYRLRYNH
jgi:hypothetical protein